jgi:hypothetical protein
VIRCEKTSEITAFLKGEAPEGDREILRLHFEQCETCRGELARFDRVLAALGKLETVDPSPGFKWRVREAFLRAHPEFMEPAKPREVPGLWESLRASLAYVPAWALSVAAHVVLLAIAAILIFTPKDPEEEARDLAVQAKPVRPGTGPEFAGSSNPRPREGIGPAVEPGPESPDFPGRAEPPPDAVIHLPKRKVDPALEKVDAGKWRERIPRDRRLLAFFEARGGEIQQNELREAFGAQGVEKAVKAGLGWLARQQQPDGSWKGPVVRLESGGEGTYGAGLTGLALLAFLGEGHTTRSGDHAAAVRRGVEYLLSEQKVTGLIGADAGNAMYNHGIAALALLEASLGGRDEALSTAAAMAVMYAVSAQNADGGWGYTSRAPENDTSVAAWLTHLLRMSKLAGNQGVISPLVQAHRSLLARTDAEGRVGYRSRLAFPNGPHGLTAAGMFGLAMTSHTLDRELVERQLKVVLERPPIAGTDTAFQPVNDLYFAYFGSLALQQVGSEAAWKQWWPPLQAALLKAQEADGAWPAAFDRWYGYGGPVYATAMGVLILETPTRYPRLLE